MYTLKELVELYCQEKNPDINLWHYIGDFLDYFYSDVRTSEERLSLVSDEPQEGCTKLSDKDYAFIAGLVHKISFDYAFKPPEWVIKDIYFLKEPYFSNNAKGKLRLVLLVESPYEFRMRNIFTSANSLDRV